MGQAYFNFSFQHEYSGDFSLTCTITFFALVLLCWLFPSIRVYERLTDKQRAFWRCMAWWYYLNWFPTPYSYRHHWFFILTSWVINNPDVHLHIDDDHRWEVRLARGYFWSVNFAQTRLYPLLCWICRPVYWRLDRIYRVSIRSTKTIGGWRPLKGKRWRHYPRNLQCFIDLLVLTSQTLVTLLVFPHLSLVQPRFALLSRRWYPFLLKFTRWVNTWHQFRKKWHMFTRRSYTSYFLRRRVRLLRQGVRFCRKWNIFTYTWRWVVRIVGCLRYWFNSLSRTIQRFWCRWNLTFYLWRLVNLVDNWLFGSVYEQVRKWRLFLRKWRLFLRKWRLFLRKWRLFLRKYNQFTRTWSEFQRKKNPYWPLLSQLLWIRASVWRIWGRIRWGFYRLCRRPLSSQFYDRIRLDVRNIICAPAIFSLTYILVEFILVEGVSFLSDLILVFIT
jgi:hypothetical protein